MRQNGENHQLKSHITELLFARCRRPDRRCRHSSDYPRRLPACTRREPAALDVEGLLKLKPTLIVLWDSGTPASRKTQLERLNLRLYVTDHATWTTSARR